MFFPKAHLELVLPKISELAVGLDTNLTLTCAGYLSVMMH